MSVFKIEGENTMHTKEQIGIRIKELREKRGLKSKELAYKLEISTGHLTNIEKGNRMPRLTILAKVADLFNVEFDDLLGVPESLRKEAAQLAQEGPLPIPTIDELSDAELNRNIKAIEQVEDEENVRKLKLERTLRQRRKDREKLVEVITFKEVDSIFQKR